VRLEALVKLKNPFTSSGLEPTTTFRFVAEFLNHYATMCIFFSVSLLLRISSAKSPSLVIFLHLPQARLAPSSIPTHPHFRFFMVCPFSGALRGSNAFE
jgi:hypothetical protein